MTDAYAIIIPQDQINRILNGTKTQHRMALTPTPHQTDGVDSKPIYYPGQRLWVQEEWGIEDGTKDHTGRDPDSMVYRSDNRVRAFDNDDNEFLDEIEPFHDDCWYGGEWESAADMPQWASRITLEVVDVQVQFVDAITLKEVEAEGHPDLAAFFIAFEKSYGAHLSNSNPYVWALTFKTMGVK